MNKNSRLYAVLSYITWIGFVIAFIMRDKDDTLVKRHLNQALIINLAQTIGGILIRIGGIFGTVGTIINVVCLVLFFVGIYRAFKMSEEPLPVIGDFTIIS
jgi:uncharacterized membrane protein